jgi:S-adenosylmethionine decarboxylase
MAMQHVMLDLYSCRTDLLANEPYLRQVLDDYPDLIGMEKVSPVELRYIATNDPRDAGHSGFVIIATSHVSLHAWPAYRMVNIDIFSCEPFDREAVLRFAMDRFQTTDIEMHVVERARRSPRRSEKSIRTSAMSELYAGEWPGFKSSFEMPDIVF